MFSSERMYTYVKGFAAGAKMPETLRTLTYARDKHRDQLRKDGQPYIVHPLTMACHALALGFREDDVIAAILLHDVCEDCGVSPEELPVSDAKERLSLDEFKAQMKGIYTTSVSVGTLDESPMAYKSAEDILAPIAESVDIIEVLRPVYNFKA